MDEKAISRVLDTCQGDFDEALEKLTELSLTTNSSPTAEQAERAQAAQQQQSPIAQTQKRSEEAPKPAKAPATGSHDLDEVQRWAVALSDDVTSAVDTQDLQRRIFHFLTLCKEHVERTQAEATSTQLQDLQNQNAVLKKAVAIQHARLAKNTGEKENQIQELQGMLSQCQNRIQALEAANYALNLHLKQATTNADMLDNRPPDVF